MNREGLLSRVGSPGLITGTNHYSIYVLDALALLCRLVFTNRDKMLGGSRNHCSTSTQTLESKGIPKICSLLSD